MIDFIIYLFSISLISRFDVFQGFISSTQQHVKTKTIKTQNQKYAEHDPQKHPKQIPRTPSDRVKRCLAPSP